MEPNAFNILAEQVNREHFFRLFGIPLNTSSRGIDLIDHSRKIAVELKGALAKKGCHKHNFNFKIYTHQIYQYPQMYPGYEFFWAFMPFELGNPISKVTPKNLEGSIEKRELWLFPWNYIHTFTTFDEELYTTFGSGDLEAAFRILGLPNPYKQRPSKNPSKPTIKVARSQLHIRSDRYNRIPIDTTNIFLDRSKCETLFQAYQAGPYKRNKPKQLSLGFI